MAVNNNVTSGGVAGPGPLGEIIGGFLPNGVKTVKPITFLGGTVTSFSATLGIGGNEESSLNVELVNDCFVNLNPDGTPNTQVTPDGEHFLGNMLIGSPVYFDLGPYTTYAKNYNLYLQELAQGKEFFTFGGILQSFTANQGSNGLTFSARVVDPRFLLGGVTLVLSETLNGPVKHRNYYNLYAYWEWFAQQPSTRTPTAEAFPSLNTQDTLIQDEQNAPFTNGEPPAQVLNQGDTCRFWGTSSLTDSGMPYARVLDALKALAPKDAVGPLVYSPNYGSAHYPPLTGRELTEARKSKTLLHDKNVFQLDLTTFPDPSTVPSYYRISGPTTNILDLLTQTCEIAGYIYHVTLEPDPRELAQGKPFPPIIKIHLEDIKKLLNVAQPGADFASTIVGYNGRATDLSYGKELGTDTSRTIMVGEKRHSMFFSSMILPFFGEDKFGKAIVPVYNNLRPAQLGDPEPLGGDCGFTLRIYLDELQDMLRCPLYDYEDNPLGKPFDEPLHLDRYVELSEWHLRAAMSSYEVWENYVFNPYNNEDFTRIIRRNFPDLSKRLMVTIYKNLLQAKQKIQPNGQPVPPVDLDDVQFAPGAPARAAGDNLNQAHEQRELEFTKKLRQHDMEQVFNFISQFARTYYGRQYVALFSHSFCVREKDTVDWEVFLDAGIQPITATNPVTNSDVAAVMVRNPCDPHDDGEILANNVWQPRLYTHEPTNAGAWIEQCGTVLGLGGTGGDFYLNQFRSDDNRVLPIARFDSKLVTQIRGVEGSVDDQLVDIQGQGHMPLSHLADIYPPVDDPDPLNLNTDEFIGAVCGGLDYRNWPWEDFFTYIPLIHQEEKLVACPPPVEGLPPRYYEDIATIIWSKITVGDKVYLDRFDAPNINNPAPACRTLTRSTFEWVRDPNAHRCCGNWQDTDTDRDCYWDPADHNGDPMPVVERCGKLQEVIQQVQACDYVMVPFSFDNGCYARYCGSAKQLEMIATNLEIANGWLGNPDMIDDLPEEGAITFDVTKGATVTVVDSKLLPQTQAFCYLPKPSGIEDIAATLDFSSQVVNKIHPPLVIPDAVAIPMVSNLHSYGPWKSAGFDVNSGGVEFLQDPDFNPWLFSSSDKMNAFAQDYVDKKNYNKTEIETGSIKFPGFPDIKLGFLENGPNLTNITVNVGSNGVTSTYQFRTFTPKFGSIKSLQKKALIDNFKEIRKIHTTVNRNKNRDQKIQNRTGVSLPSVLQNKRDEEGTLQRVLIGEAYPFSIMTDLLYSRDSLGNKIPGTAIPYVAATGYRTVVGTDSLSKSVLELRYDYKKKAFMSMDGLFSPVANIRPYFVKQEFEFTIGTQTIPYFKDVPVAGPNVPNAFPGHYLPIFGRYDHEDYTINPRYQKENRSSPTLPNPPAIHTYPNSNNTKGGQPLNDNRIAQNTLNPLLPSFGNYEDTFDFEGIKYSYGHSMHIGSGVGHCIDMVGRGDILPSGGMIVNFFSNRSPLRYSADNRFLGLRGPIVLHQWGYDTQGKPIPNAIDNEKLIVEQGKFRTQVRGDLVDPTKYPYLPPSVTVTGTDELGAYTHGLGLTDYFMQDWMGRPQTWPVGPIDLRWDRKRGVWVSPPSHRMVVVEAKEGVSAYGSGIGRIINDHEGEQYGPLMYNSSGVAITGVNNNSFFGNEVVVEDRIGNSVGTGDKRYAFFDSFTSTYLLMGGGGGEVVVGKFCNQWPSLSNVKDPKNAVKEVILYKHVRISEGTSLDAVAPWNLQPQTVKKNGIDVPVTVNAVNLFSNVAAAEYETKWCALLSNGGNYYLIAAEC